MPTLAPLVTNRRLLFEANSGCPWANVMVLNPGVIRDPTTGRLHMLFRATGDGRTGHDQPDADWPFPIYLGYAYSDDNADHWEIDFSKPAMKPTLATTPDALTTVDAWGQESVNFANGCIEDPRLFMFEGQCMLIVACRVFPPGAYWLKDDPMQCAPAWAREPGHGLGRAVRDNITVNLLYQVDLDSLTRGDYGSAFKYLTHLSNPEYGENRDVLLFPRKLDIRGQAKVACLHRPWENQHYPGGSPEMPPSMWYALGDSIDELHQPQAKHELLASPKFVWESNRIGASAPPLEIEPGLWLISYHGKQDRDVGYTQSFMIVEENGKSAPRIRHRCPERILIPTEDWEQPGRFKTPCLFVTSIIPKDKDTLLVIYGAADESIGMAEINLSSLISTILRYDEHGGLTRRGIHSTR